ncbi:tRNA lysidine(34) synthetase TilS [Haloechinothrix sp. YIM 98757]|uniref:tRNA(Ile)-lysidine synthase n=1 Tax=Haloechinothrix aidingensis TaxID=2752311 RepID=A0A838AF96_9PSEU|nr:tRNA lysidine(34) synthetase TilS [Haloechinothrix aidingensis]MBA0127881.1 tRNA lysidine(34) synthetase TilS [Haloechinothrix aidingensis]
MTGNTVGPAGLRVRSAVRDLLGAPECAPHRRAGVVGVAISGGADSLALADAAAYCCARLGMATRGLVVDHRMQDGSAATAAWAAETARSLGVAETRVLPVDVHGAGGPEAAARQARYAALRAAMPEDGALVLLGHTRDDQAETVLLGLGRGSGPRSIAGMRPLDPPWARPLLDLPRSDTQLACAELGVRPWHDPHNADPRFTRSRLRTEVFPLLEDVLQDGVAGALARTAAQLREDLVVLDELAGDLYAKARVPGHGDPGTGDVADGLDAETLGTARAALRRRAIRHWLHAAGARDLSDGHLRSVDALVSAWRGQGGVWLPGNLVASRSHGTLRVQHFVSGSVTDRQQEPD